MKNKEMMEKTIKQQEKLLQMKRDISRQPGNLAKNRAVKQSVDRMSTNLHDLAGKIQQENDDLKTMITNKIADLKALEAEIAGIAQKKQQLEDGSNLEKTRDEATIDQVNMIYNDWEKRRTEKMRELKSTLIELQNSQKRLQRTEDEMNKKRDELREKKREI